MAGSLGSELVELVPLALVITLSPLSIIPAILVLHTPHKKQAGLAYLVGWIFALAAMTLIFVEVSNLLSGVDKTPRWASYLRIVIGLALIVFGLYRWFTRHTSAHTPAWLRKITEASPAKAGVFGALLAVVNPKVVFICVAAGLSIGTAGLGLQGALFAEIYFVAIAAASVALPVLAVVVAGDRLDEPLERLKEWMEKNHAALVAVILVAIGLMVLYKGIHTLA